MLQFLTQILIQSRVMVDLITKLTYQTLQQGQLSFALAHKTMSSRLLQWISPLETQRTQPVSSEVLLKIQANLEKLRQVDWEDMEKGVYSADVLFDQNWQDFWLHYPLFFLDLFSAWERYKQQKYQDFADDIDTVGYPRYYLQNFHYQTDGYLSELSANLYDVGVDLLFNGAADAMRRRVLAPLKQGLERLYPGVSLTDSESRQIKVLDIACGTGRLLKLIRGMLPKVSLFGVDLSPTYLRKAHQLLGQVPGYVPQLFQGNAEDLVYRDQSFAAVTCVFLFHELPAPIRQRVIEEAFRVIQPGGTLIICDSIQMSDSPEFERVMKNFSTTFHEPYYQDYIYDDLVKRLEVAGFQKISTQTHFMSKYWVAIKPAP